MPVSQLLTAYNNLIFFKVKNLTLSLTSIKRTWRYTSWLWPVIGEVINQADLEVDRAPRRYISSYH